MGNISKIIFTLILWGATSFSIAVGSTLFTITPSTTNLELSSNGSSSVIYTVTNNANTSTVPVITANYHSSGYNLTIASDTCSSAISPSGSCTFRVLISGTNQPTNFTITPRVCGFNNFICSVSSRAVSVIVHRPGLGLATRAYQEVIDSNSSMTTLLGININDPSDRIEYNLNFTNSVNGVVVSPDGRKVYAAQKDGGGNSSVAIFDVMPDSLILNSVVNLSGMATLNASPPSNLHLALTPDGTNLFVTQSSGINVTDVNRSIPALPLFRIDLTSDSNMVTVIEDPDHILIGASSLVVSPDSNTLYIGTDSDYIVAMPVNALSVSSSNKLVEGNIPNDNHLSLAIDPAGNKLYVGNYLEGSVSILAIDGMDAQFEQTILNNGDFSGAAGIVVSPDGETLYVAERDDNSVVSVSLSNLDSGLVQGGILGAFGLSLSPNGSLLYVTQAEDGVNRTTVLNAINFFAIPTVLTIDGMSLTLGKFIGP